MTLSLGALTCAYSYLASAGSAKYGLTTTNMTNITMNMTDSSGNSITETVQGVAIDALSQVCDPNVSSTLSVSIQFE